MFKVHLVLVFSMRRMLMQILLDFVIVIGSGALMIWKALSNMHFHLVLVYLIHGHPISNKVWQIFHWRRVYSGIISNFTSNMTKENLRKCWRKARKSNPLLSNNKSVIAMIKILVYYYRTKYIRMKHHFIREIVEDENIQLKYRKTKNQVTDIFTKALPRDKSCYLRVLK